jgi:23S rRNA (guanosine2251-2'-O)-methyltransferase
MNRRKRNSNHDEPAYLYGIHAVKTLLQYDASRVTRAWVDSSRGDALFRDLLQRLDKKGISYERVERSHLDQLTQQAVHQGVVVQVTDQNYKKLQDEEAFSLWLEEQSGPLFLLILDGIQDPHNLGAALRTAAAAHCDAVIIPKNRAVGLTPAAHKVACGATELLSLFQVTNLSRVLDRLREAGVWIVGAEGSASTSLYEIDFRGSIAIVMGAEGKGMRRLTRDKCDYLAAIPISKKMESLNVSVAAGVFLFEAVRQRQSQ